ncbi:hypothetical protein D5086_026988 [Populus alba]|uniref:Uncharacterized protein n=1 Tax=Populus alba TaxID=43335 RepID=A0ACC4B4Y0_POPAL
MIHKMLLLGLALSKKVEWSVGIQYRNVLCADLWEQKQFDSLLNLQLCYGNKDEHPKLHKTVGDQLGQQDPKHEQAEQS